MSLATCSYFPAAFLRNRSLSCTNTSSVCVKPCGYPAVAVRGAHRANVVDDGLTVVVAIDAACRPEGRSGRRSRCRARRPRRRPVDGDSRHPRGAAAPEDPQLVRHDLVVIGEGARDHRVARDAPVSRWPGCNTCRRSRGARAGSSCHRHSVARSTRPRAAARRSCRRLRREQRVAVPHELAADEVRIARRRRERVCDLRPGVVRALEDVRRVGADRGHAVVHGHRREHLRTGRTPSTPGAPACDRASIAHSRGDTAGRRESAAGSWASVTASPR